MSSHKSHGLVLAIHPTSRGFGWVLFEGAMVPVNWGIASAKRNRNETCMSRFKQLLDQYQPTAVVLEKFGKEDSRRRERIGTLAQTMRGFAENRDMDVLVYSREEVSNAVAGKGKTTRNAVARAAANRFPMLRHRLPDDRKLWDSEDGRRCLFDAVALGIAHFSLTGSAPDSA